MEQRGKLFMIFTNKFGRGKRVQNNKGEQKSNFFYIYTDSNISQTCIPSYYYASSIKENGHTFLIYFPVQHPHFARE